jgi:hypothetical protein
MVPSLVRRHWRGVAALIFCGTFAAAAHATPVTLTDGNSSVNFDPGSLTGQSSWVVDGTNELTEGWLWGTTSTGALSSLSHQFSSGGLLSATYQGDGFNTVLNFTLVGGSAGSGTSSIIETLTFNNTSDAPISARLFEFEQFALNGNPNNNTLTLSGSPVNTADQTDPLGTDANVVATGGAAAPDFYQIGTNGSVLALLASTHDTVTLNDNSTGPLMGDDSFAFEWEPTIDAGGSFQISVDKTITGGAAAVPLPSAALSGAGLLSLLTGIALVRKAKRVLA